MKFYKEDGWYIAESENWFQEYETLEELLEDYPEVREILQK